MKPTMFLALRCLAAKSQAAQQDGTRRWRHARNLLLFFLPFYPVLLHHHGDTFPSRRGHGPPFGGFVGASGRSAPAFTPAADTLQSLDRSVKPSALLLELLDNLVNVHAGMLTLAYPASTRKHEPSPQEAAFIDHRHAVADVNAGERPATAVFWFRHCFPFSFVGAALARFHRFQPTLWPTRFNNVSPKSVSSGDCE